MAWQSRRMRTAACASTVTWRRVCTCVSWRSGTRKAEQVAHICCNDQEAVDLTAKRR